MTSENAASGSFGSAFWRIVRLYVPAALLFVSGIALWEGLVVVFDIKGFLLPKPTAIAESYLENQDVIWSASFTTIREAVGGFLIGSTVGVLIALLTSRFRVIREGGLPLAIAINSTPIIALAPVFNVWFGITDPLSKMAVVAVMVFFPVMINMTRGLSLVDPGIIEMLHSYGASERQTLTKVRIPNSLPLLFSAFRVGVVLAVIGAIVAEYFGGPARALGVYISQQAGLTRFANAWSAIIVASLIGIIFYSLVALGERLAMPWRRSLAVQGR